MMVYTTIANFGVFGGKENMPNTKDSLRQPVFKGIRYDVLPQECQMK